MIPPLRKHNYSSISFLENNERIYNLVFFLSDTKLAQMAKAQG